MLLCAWLLWTQTWLSNEGAATMSIINGQRQHGQVASWTSLGWTRAREADGIAYYDTRAACDIRAHALRRTERTLRVETRCVPAGEPPQP